MTLPAPSLSGRGAQRPESTQRGLGPSPVLSCPLATCCCSFASSKKPPWLALGTPGPPHTPSLGSSLRLGCRSQRTLCSLKARPEPRVCSLFTAEPRAPERSERLPPSSPSPSWLSSRECPVPLTEADGSKGARERRGRKRRPGDPAELAAKPRGWFRSRSFPKHGRASAPGSRPRCRQAQPCVGRGSQQRAWMGSSRGQTPWPHLRAGPACPAGSVHKYCLRHISDNSESGGCLRRGLWKWRV